MFWFQVSELKEDGEGATYSATKRFVTASEHADSYVSQCRRPGAKGPMDLTAFLVRRKNAGVKVKGGFDGLGLRGNESSPVELAGYKIPKADLMCPHGEGLPFGLGIVLPWFNIGTAAMAHGLCRSAIATTAAHLQGTSFEHDKSKLRDLPTLRARLAEMQVTFDQSRALLRYALDLIESPTPATVLYVLQTRYAAINAALEVTDLAMKACGGVAFAKHLGVERAFRDARAGWVMAPTSDASADFIGRALTGMDLF
ncbi:acyl-CoA dehydrogenase [bacterium]|nr:acyl-CoA dehydrogenase [bacterium]